VKYFIFFCDYNTIILQAVGRPSENAMTLCEDLTQWSVLAWNVEKHAAG